MKTAKVFRHGGSQAVRLPKEFRFEGTEVTIERRGNEVVLTPRPVEKTKTLGDLAKLFAARKRRSGWEDFELPPRPKKHERDAPTW